MTKRVGIGVISFALLLACATALAQQSNVSYTDNFQSYGTQANPAGWVDTSIGNTKPQADGLYKTWPDPLQSANVVYGTKQSSGKPEGSNPRIGTFSTYAAMSFPAAGRFEYRGRFLRTDVDARIGLTFLSAYPEVDKYYLIGLWSNSGSSNLTLQLFGFGAGTFTGTTNSGVAIAPNDWYRFLIQVDDVDNATKIRARFWPDGTPEPSTFSIDAADAAPSRLKSGRIGMWAADKGDAYIDDLSAKSPVDNTPPVITFVEGTTTLPANALTKFGREIHVDVRATDASGIASITATVDGQPYTPLAAIGTDGRHTIHARTVDTGGNASESDTDVLIDRTAPVVSVTENGQPFVSGIVVKRNVVPQLTVTDLTTTTVAAQLQGSGTPQPYTFGTPISAEGSYILTATVTDEFTHSTTITITFTIDKSGPAMSFRTPAANAVLTARDVVVTGNAGEAVSVTVNGVAATINAAKEFTTPPIEIQEGANTITAIGVDGAGNSTTISMTVRLDTRAPELTVTAPATNVCLDVAEVVVAGTVSDDAVSEVKVTAGATVVTATLSADHHSFTAAVPASAEGELVLRIEARDIAGHASTVVVPVTIDRTKPLVEINEGGRPFTATLLARPISLFVRASDADSSATVVATLDGQPYASGTPIAGEGAHELRATASDCAGHHSDERVLHFSIDQTPPSLVSITPANGTKIAQKPAVTGLLSEPGTVIEERSGRAAVMSGAGFTLDAILEEGINTLSFLATDAAGNEARIAYSVTVDSLAPTIEIVENGSLIAANALFARAVTPVIQSSDAAAIVTATNNGAPFTSGTTLSADGSYTIAAQARDALGNESASTSVTFRIDRTPPTIAITSPAAHAVIDGDTVDIRGTVTGGDVASIVVNGTPTSLTGDAFAATIRLDLDTNVITAIATDRAGNAASASVEVDRDRGALALLLTAPADKMLTNRPTAVVAGQILTPAAARSLTINGAPLTFDAGGTFRRNDFPLVEGDNVITAALTSTTALPSTVRVTVTADFTPPLVEVLANGAALADGARFAAPPSLTLHVTDNSAAPPVQTLTVDGELVAPGVVSLADGGHALTAIARDAAGNETRIDRVFFVGDLASVSGCGLTNFEPASGAAVFAETVHITGRSGGAAGVLINGNAASVADGSFCGEATLALGPNEVTIQCADAAGHPTTDAPVVLVIHRYGDPEISITSPEAGALVTTNKVTVSGTVGDGVVSGDVNGIAYTVAENAHTFSVADVPVTPGLNVLIARAKTSSSRGAATSVTVRVAGGTPQLSITSPLTGSETGAQNVDVSGTWTNVDPSTIAVTVGAGTYPATVTSRSDTTGTFIAAGVQLAPGATTTITATARSATGAQASASTDVRHVPTAPSIVITSPSDNSVFASTHSGPVQVAGTFVADPGSQVQVNGVTATLAGNAFTADVDISAATAGITPVIARVITSDGRQATDSVRLVRLLAPLAVKESFPANDAIGVDPGVAVVILFTNAVDRSTADAVRVTDGAGANVAGPLFVDRDAITFAPTRPFRNGERYTVTIAATLKDIAGAPMAAAHSFHFTVAGTAPVNAPIVDETTTTGCFSGTTITGRVANPGARVRLDVDGVTMTAVSSDTGAFQFTFTFSGQSGYHLVRVREIGTDGTLSAERALCFRINCAVPQIMSAVLDRTAKTLTLQFSKAMEAATLVAGAAGSILIVPEGESALAGTVAMNATNDVATITLAAVPQKTIALTVKTTAKDATGAPLAADFTQTFLFTTDPTAGRGDGYITGAVYDATNGRPLATASVSILHSQFPILNSVNGHYTRSLAEGAYTIQATAPGYTTVWRQIVVPPGAGVVPIDIRLTKRGPPNASLTLTHGGDTKVTKSVELQLAAGSLTGTNHVRLTSVGAQSLAGLLPLGWSPFAAAELVLDDATVALPGAKLTFVIDAAAVTAASQTLSLAQYDSERDEWRTVVAVANVSSDGRVTFDINSAGNYALVYPDKGSTLVARVGAPLPSAGNPCTATPDVCRVVSRSFTLDPNAVLPSGRTVATLTIDGAKAYPSGTAVQAFIDEHLNLADGRVLVDPPFATDLLIYRTLAGDAAIADFHLSPSAQATGVILRDGVDRIRIVDYPGRIDRGTLIGAEGGRVPGDDSVTVDVPAGATQEPLHASTASIAASELAAFGPIAGFHIAGGFTLALTRTSQPPLPEGMTPADVVLLTPARATVSVSAAATSSVVIAEVLSSTPYGTMVRLVALTSTVASLDIPGVRVVSTRPIVSTQLPLDGIVRPGRYLVLVADAPIAYAYGQVQLASGLAAANARITTPALGVRDLTRIDGLFVVPVPSTPAAPFTIVPRTTATGDGAAYVAASAPAAEVFVNVGVLTLTAQPPRLQSVSPADGAQVDAGALVVQAAFDVALDATSIADGIRLADATTGAAVAGTIALNGSSIVRFTPAQSLRPGSRFTITIAPTIRSAAGAAFARTATSHFTTRALASNANIRPERIRITIPDAAGKSTIAGSPGALPSGAIALAVRRGQFFLDSYTATAAADGSFSFDVGHRNAADRITLDDAIDLEVLDAVSRAIIAVVPLTPFSTADGRAFLAAPDRPSTFTSVDGIRVTVPAGAFDATTLVSVAPAQKTAFAHVPKFDVELGYATSIEITFDGVANKAIDVAMPVPAGFDPTGRDWLLGYLGQSVRGPRVMIVDVLRVENGMFRTGLASSSASGNAKRVATNAAIFGEELQQYLAKVRRSGIYATVNLSVPGAAAGFISGLQASFDVFWDTLESLYAAHFYVADNEGKIVIPVITGKPFTIVGVDAGTGLEAFSKVYDPIPPGDPGAAVALPNPYPDRAGPYPVFGTPFRIETLDADVENIALRSVRDFTVTLRGGNITAETTLAADVGVAMFNATNGKIDWSRTGGLSVEGAVGDRIVLLVAQRDVDPNSTLSIVFSEPLALPTGGDVAVEDYLRTVIRVETRAESAADFVPITGALRLRVDSGGRRVLIETPASLNRGNRYRIAIDPALADRAGLRIGQTRNADGNIVGGLASPLYLELAVREPGGLRASFDIASGAIRDQALNGNVLFMTALDGGVLAYDVSNPAGMDADTLPLGHVSGGAISYWGIASDHHGRVYTTGLGGLFGSIQSFRLEDFLPTSATAGTTREVPVRASAIVSFVPGASAALAIDSRVIAGDRPEAIPRKIQILLQDNEDAFDSRAAFKSAAGATTMSTTGDLEMLDVDLARDADLAYATQRITVENTTLDMRWSADATLDTPAHITGIVARANDRLRVIRNRATYGVVSLFGYGVGVFDLNAMDSNDNSPETFGRIREGVRLTDGKMPGDCDPLTPDAIPDISFTPDAMILTRPDSADFHVFALDANRGVLDLTIQPPTTAPADNSRCDERSPLGLRFHNRYFLPGGQVATYDDPRLLQLRTLFQQLTGREPIARYTGASPYHWTLEAKDNRVTTAPDITPALGARGSIPNTRVTRDYMLIPGNEYGLLVVEVGGDPAPTDAPPYTPLEAFHLVDVIWIPDGAYAVRAIPRTHLATVIDGKGHVLLVDLSRIDERWNDRGAIAEDELFSTVAGILASSVDTPDPRIVWKSATPLASGTLAPVIDPDTGFVFVGKLLDKTTNVVAATDPRIQIKADVGAANGLSEIGGIVPLGVDPPPSVQLTGENASLAAFRVEVALPGAISESLTGGFRLALESERVAGAKTEDTPPGWPRAHLNVAMTRAVPDSMQKLRYQRGFNKWISPWIVGIADPRANEQYTWPSGWDAAQKAAGVGCHQCERPPALKGRTEADGVYELWSAGRLFVARADLGDLSPTPYDYLGNAKRLETRFFTTPADTVRSTTISISPQSPQVAAGALAETTYVHSGEIETSAFDLDAEGRAGWNVGIERTYRSQTLGFSAFGAGWESPVVRRLRPLPTGDVEYRDGIGEVWTFHPTEAGYTSPRGLFLKLARTEAGWILIDQQRNASHFDNLGRLVAESDDFANAVSLTKDEGNVIRYLYDPSGRLAVIVDPVERQTTVSYDGESARIHEIKDWRGRLVTYGYDSDGRLESVKGPQVSNGAAAANSFAGRPETRYGYLAASSSYNDRIELHTNLRTITDPVTAPGTDPRITFDYDTTTSSSHRDRVTRQTWATGETATFDVTAAGSLLVTQASVTDVLGQNWIYDIGPGGAAQRRVDKITVSNVPVFERTSENTPQALLEQFPQPQTLSTEVLSYDGDGRAVEVRLPYGLITSMRSEKAGGGAAGSRVHSIVESGDGATRATTIQYDPNNGAENNPLRVARSKTETPDEAEFRDAPTPSRVRRQLASKSDDVQRTSEYDAFGQLLTTAQKDLVAGNDTDVVQRDYYGVEAPAIARGRIRHLKQPGGVDISYTYQTKPAGDLIVISDAVRGTTTTIERDMLARPIHQVITRDGETLSDESYGYDANGQLVYSARQQRELGIVESRMRYDAMLRIIEQSTSHAAVSGTPQVVKVRTDYDLKNPTSPTITQSDPFIGESPASVAKEITTLDHLGRLVESKRVAPDGAQTRRVIHYGRQGRPTYESDGKRYAIVRGFDVFGRETFSVDSLMQRHEKTWTAWDDPVEEKWLDGGMILVGGTAQTIGHLKRAFTRNGEVRSITEELIAGSQYRQTRFGWENGGRITRTYVAPVTGIDEPIREASRAVEQERDSAGRTIAQRIGQAAGLTGVFVEGGVFQESVTASNEYDGMLPATVHTREPRAGASFVTLNFRDGLGRATTVVAPGGYITERDFDEAGNVLSEKVSGHDLPSKMHYDSRGLPTTRIQAALGEPAVTYEYDALGALKKYQDEEGKVTRYDTDGLGRVVRTVYPDATCEQAVYEKDSGAVLATRDRAGQWLVYHYGGYVLEEIRLGPIGTSSECTAAVLTEAPPADATLIRYSYDLANRLKKIVTADAATEYDDYDLGGRPATTRTIRYANHSGLTTAEILDVHTQRHAWSAFDGERDRYRMPVAGATASSTATSSTWRSWVEEKRDGVGNLVSQKAIRTETSAAVGPFISESVPRSVGRLSLRQRTLDNDQPLKTFYAYAESPTAPAAPELPIISPAPGPRSGLLGRAEFSVAGAIIGGAEVTRDPARRIGILTPLGSGGRQSDFSYDDRDRLTRSVLGGVIGETNQPTVDDRPDPADFRMSRTVTRLTDSERAVIGARAEEIALPSFTATPNDAHQITALDYPGEFPPDVTFAFAGGRRTSDGVWQSKYDTLGRLVQLTRIADIANAAKRYEYDYNASNRVVGRRVCSNGDTNPCVLEVRDGVLANEILPAATTFVWDPITDRLVSIFEAGKSIGATSEYAGLLRQYIHGDRSYDDPVEVLASPMGGGNAIRYLPIFDEAGTGSLSAVVRSDGTLIERVLYGDAYGASPRYLRGPVVDGVTMRKEGTGASTRVVITMHVTDAVETGSIAAGTHLRSVLANGSIATISVVVPRLDGSDAHTLTWTLNESEWTALTGAAGVVAIEAVVTDQLRAMGWGAAAMMPPPDWLRQSTGAQTAPGEPLIVRERVATIDAGDGESQRVYEVRDLYLLASAESRSNLLLGFKAAPFVERATGLVYVRDRWYDPASSTWLTPDGDGYGSGSSNLYAAFLSDPINNNDPDGRNPLVGGLVGTIAGSGYALYRGVRYDEEFFGANGTWRYVVQGAVAGALIGTGAGAPVGLSLLGATGYGAAFGAGVGGAVGSVASEGSWSGFTRGTVKGGILGGIGGATGFGISGAGLSSGWSFAGSVTADTYAGVAVDAAFGDIDTIEDSFQSNLLWSLAGNTVARAGRRLLLGPSGNVRELEVGRFDDLTSRSPVGDRLTHDHMPSVGALKAAEEARLGRSLTASEARALRACTYCIVMRDSLHDASRTFKGRNTLGMRLTDSQDLFAAARRDSSVFFRNAVEQGLSPMGVRLAILKLHFMNLVTRKYRQ